jgi:hypothetical protein
MKATDRVPLDGKALGEFGHVRSHTRLRITYS